MLLKIVKYMFLKIFELNFIRRLPLFSTHMPEQKILIMRKQKYSSFYTSSGAKYHISKSSTLTVRPTKIPNKMGKARQRLVSIIYARPIAIFSKVSKLINFEIFLKEEWVVFDRIMKFTCKFMSKN